MKAYWCDMGELDDGLVMWGKDCLEQRQKVKDFYKTIYYKEVPLNEIIFNPNWNRGYVYTNWEK